MKKEKNNGVTKLRIIIYVLILILIFETSAFVTFVACNAIFIDNYKAALEKAAYVDEMAQKEYQQWLNNKFTS
jgi:hypothetical protein